MGRFDFVSPGAVAGDAITQYFTQLEQRRRQQMADQLALDREARLKEHDKTALEVQRAQLENTKAGTQSLNDQRASATAAAEQKRFTESHMLGDTVNPENAKRFPGMVATSPLAQGAQIAVSEDDIPTYDVTGGESTFKGTPEQRKVAEDRQRRADYIKTLDPKSPQAQFLAAQDATGDTSLPYQMFQGEQTGRIFQNGRDGKIGLLDSATGQVRPLGPEDKPFNKDVDQIVTQPAAPSAGNTTVNMGSGGVDLAAWQYLQTGTMPPLGMGAGNLRAQILERAAELSQQGGINPQANATLYGADKAALTQLNRTLTAISAFESTAQKNIVQMQEAMKGVSDTGIPIINAPLRELQRMTGSPEVAKYQASIRVVIPELARILTQPNLAGMLTDQARHEIENVVRGDATVEQANAVIDLLLQDMKNRKAGLIAERDALMSGVNQRGPAGFPGMVTPGQAAGATSPPPPPSPSTPRKRYNPATRKIE